MPKCSRHNVNTTTNMFQVLITEISMQSCSENMYMIEVFCDLEDILFAHLKKLIGCVSQFTL